MELAQLQQRYRAYQNEGLKLNIARGKPGPDQLDLSAPLLTLVDGQNYKSPSGVDTRNYGELNGLSECRALLAELMQFPVEQIKVTGTSSLTTLYDTVARLLLTTPPDGKAPWFTHTKRKMICLVPGYDRHFDMAAGLGFELLSLQLKDTEPDLHALKQLVRDPDVLGIFCVPYYSNPSGNCYSADFVKTLCEMETAAPDFRIFWDMAYCVHHLNPDEPCPRYDVLQMSAAAGHPNRFLCYASTSKITFAGGGVAGFAASPDNLAWFEAQQKLQQICTDKINQLCHVRFFQNVRSLDEQMRRQAELLRPKFAAVLETFDREIKDLPGVHYARPKGGYFIGLTLPKGTAKRVHQLAKEAGLTLTGPGATHPYKNDPDDAYLRIAPSYPQPDEVRKAAELLACCVQLAIAEQQAALGGAKN